MVWAASPSNVSGAEAERGRNRMPKVGIRRTRQVFVGEFRQDEVDAVGPAGEVGPDHFDRTLRPDEVAGPRQVVKSSSAGVRRS